MKRLKLEVRPKRLKISSSTQTEERSEANIDVLLEAHHSNTKENLNTPYFKWIKFTDQLPLDNDDPIFVYSRKFLGLYDTKSFVALQHYLHSKFMKYGNEPDYWMRVKLPED